MDLLAHDGAEGNLSRLTAVLDQTATQGLRSQARTVTVEESVRRYLLELVRTTRQTKSLSQGASPRAALGLQRAAQARALLKGRTFVIPEDVQALAVPALAHRISARAGQHADTVIQGLLETVPVPR